MTELPDKPVIEYGTAHRANYAAMASLVFGSMLFVPFLAGVAAIIFGRLGMHAARERAIGRYRMARAGFALGIVNLIIVVVLGVAFAIHEYRESERRQCAANLRQLGLAMLLYSNANRGLDPPTLDHLVSSGELPAGSPAFACPSCAPSVPAATVGTMVRSNYVLAPPFKAQFSLRFYGSIPELLLAYEPLSNHCGRGLHVLFGDGHVEWLDARVAAQVLADLQAGENPPPSLKGR